MRLVNLLVGFRASVRSDGTLNVTRCHTGDRKSTRLNSSHLVISYAVFCLKKKSKTGDAGGAAGAAVQGGRRPVLTVTHTYSPWPAPPLAATTAPPYAPAGRAETAVQRCL